MAYVSAQPLVLLLVPILLGVTSTFICALCDHIALCRRAHAPSPPRH